MSDNIRKFLEIHLTHDAESIIKYCRNLEGEKLEITEDHSSDYLYWGDMLIFLGNNNPEDIIDTVIDISRKNEHLTDVYSFFKTVLNDCSLVYGYAISHFMLLSVFVSTYSFYEGHKTLDVIMDGIGGTSWRKKLNQNEMISPNSKLNKIFEFFINQQTAGLFVCARSIIDYLAMPENNEYPKAFLGDMIFNIAMHQFDVSLKIVSGVKNDELCFFNMYVFKDSESYVLFDFMDCIKNKVKIKKCENCGKYFIPKAKSNEIYCDNVYKNGKTCRQVGYENKLNSNDILKAYRTAYKTQNAKKLRNRHLPDIESRFKKWHMEAKNKLTDIQNGNMTLDDFKSWLKKEWL